MRTSDENDAFAAFYRKHADFVYGIAISYLRVPADAEDAAADVFMKLLEQNIQFQDDDHARAWLTVAVRNRCKNQLRSWVRSSRSEQEPETVEDPAAHMELQETLSALYALPERYRLPLVLYAVQGYRTEEIAAALSMKESTVRTRIERARKLLKKKLGRGDQT